MKNRLLRAKAFDVYGQAAMILLPILCSLGNQSAFWNLLFTLGAWQLVSFFANRKMGARPWLKPGRKAYGNALIFLLVSCVLVALVGQFVISLLIAMFVGPVLGIWYLSSARRNGGSWKHEAPAFFI
jgi:DMSO/TMAO reductase YedYZ heme-binding membrane subunit